MKLTLWKELRSLCHLKYKILFEYYFNEIFLNYSDSIIKFHIYNISHNKLIWNISH